MILDTMQQFADVIDSWDPRPLQAAGLTPLNAVGREAQQRLTTLSLSCKTLLLWH
jgi:hypothetical protein